MAWTVTTRYSQPGASSAQTAVSSSFTPAANSRLLAFAGNQPDTGSGVEVWNITDSLGGSLAGGQWVKDSQSSVIVLGGADTSCILFYQDIGASPSAMTVTIDADSGTTETYWYGVSIFDVTDGTGAHPIFAQTSATNTTTSTGNSVSLTGTLGSSPTNGNLVVGNFHSSNDTAAAYAAITGFTALVNLTGTFDHVATFYRSDTTTAAVTNSDLGTAINYGNCIVSELKSQAAAATIRAPQLLVPTAAVQQASSW